jgi:membrane-associated phospholipid phosphatase
VHAPLTFEALSITFFVGMAASAFLTRAPLARRHRVVRLSVLGAAAVAAASYMLPADLRLWLAHAYLVAGYRLPALLVPPDPGSRISNPEPIEAWLIRIDERWFSAVFPLPRWAAAVLELSYLSCYLLVPASFVFVWTRSTVDAADRFWTAVLLAGFACYGPLPWLVSWPPRARLGEPADASRIRRFNLHILERASHGFNTFPSGHVAVSVGAALAVLSLSSSAGLVALAIALAIAAGAVAGRYHYIIDVVLGAAAGVAAWLLT